MTTPDLSTSPAAFIDRYLPLNEKGKPWTLSPYQRKVLAVGAALIGVIRILLWGELKKSGKTLLIACKGIWWGFTRPYTEIKVVANDLEQSVGRVFKTMTDLLKHNPELMRSVKRITATTIELTNGTVIQAISSDYRGAAGSTRHSSKLIENTAL